MPELTVLAAIRYTINYTSCPIELGTLAKNPSNRIACQYYTGCGGVWYGLNYTCLEQILVQMNDLEHIGSLAVTIFANNFVKLLMFNSEIVPFCQIEL